MSSTLAVGPDDLARLLARHAGPRAAGFRCTVGDGALLVEVLGAQAPPPLPAFDLALEVRGALRPGPAPVLALQVRARSLPFGLQVLANTWMTAVLERVLPPDVRAASRLEPPSTLLLDLSRFAPTAALVGTAVTLASVTIPAPDGAAVRATFRVPGAPQGWDAA